MVIAVKEKEIEVIADKALKTYKEDNKYKKKPLQMQYPPYNLQALNLTQMTGDHDETPREFSEVEVFSPISANNKKFEQKNTDILEPPKEKAVDMRALVDIEDHLKRDGSVYCGQMIKQENSLFLYTSHGYGSQVYPDGSIYAGDWSRGLCQG